MAKDLTDILSSQLREVAREAANSLADSSAEKTKSRSRLSGVKTFIAGAGFALIAKQGVDAARSGAGAGLLSDVGGRISATLSELQVVPGAEAADEEPQARKAQAAKRTTSSARSRSKAAAKSPASARAAKASGSRPKAAARSRAH